MAGLQDIVSISLVTQTAAVKQPSFGVPLLLAATTEFAERSRVYDGLEAMVDDGFTTTSAGYRMAAKLLAQNPQVEKFRIGRRANAPTTQYKLTPVAVNSAEYELTIDGVDYAITADASATQAEIASALVTELGAITGWTIATADTGTTVTLTSTTPGKVLNIRPWNIALLGIEQTHADAGVSADLDAILLESTDWYGFDMSTASKAEVLAAAAWIESHKRAAIFSLSASVMATTAASGATDVGASLKTSNYARSGSVYSEATCEYAGTAALGDFLPTAPGSATLKFKTLNSVRTSNLTPTQQQNVQDRNVNVHVEYGGNAMVTEGVVALGEFFDVVRDRDWFESRMQAELFLLLKTAPKIPFTDPGIVQVESVIRKVGREGETSGFLEPDSFAVVMPRAADVSASDKATRNLTGVTFSGVIAGAIHKLTLRGTLTLT
jgi:hypothetical protein